MASPWNVDRDETARAVRRAQKFIGNRNSGINSSFGGLYYPLICHVLPLGRIGSDFGEDRLLSLGHDTGKLVPPALKNAHTCFDAHAVEFISHPKVNWVDRSFWLTWFRSGGAELRTHPGGGGVGIVQLIDEILPFLGRTAGEVLHVGGPFLVSVTVSGRVSSFGVEPPSLDPASRIVLPESDRKVTLPPTVIASQVEFENEWPSYAQKLLNQFARAFGHPSFDRAQWKQDLRR
jgi:hypothetical protein